MKKISAFITSLAIALSAAACGAVNEPSEDDNAVLQNDIELTEADGSTANASESEDENYIEAEAAIKDNIIAQLDALENGDKEAFIELNLFSALEQKSKEESDDPEFEIGQDEWEEYWDKLFEEYCDDLDGMKLSHEVKELKLTDLMTSAGHHYDSEIFLDFDMCQIAFLLFDENSGTDKEFEGFAYKYNEVWYVYFKGLEADEKTDQKSSEKEQPQTANEIAQAVYTLVATYLFDSDIIYEISEEEAIAQITGEIDCADMEKYTGIKGDLAKDIYELAVQKGYVYIIRTPYLQDTSIVVQWRESFDSDIIGQFPYPIPEESYADSGDHIVWGEYYFPEDP